MRRAGSRLALLFQAALLFIGYPLCILVGIPRGEPATFRLDQVIPGWTEGLQLMVVGETRRLWIPEQLAYKGQHEPKGLLVFDVELLKIE